MISKIEISNFKIHKVQTFNLGQLNLFAGKNGVGKSSVFQIINLLRQSQEMGRLKLGLQLNGRFCKLGSAKDVLHFSAETDQLGVVLTYPDGSVDSFQFSASNLDSSFLPIIGPEDGESGFSNPHFFSSPWLYLGANRVGSLASFPVDDYLVKVLRDLSDQEGRGDLVAHYLDVYGTENLHIDIPYPNQILAQKDSKKFTIYEMVVLWMREISMGVNIHIDRFGTGNGFSVQYSFNRSNERATEKMKGVNVGFGIGYALPIVVALVSAKKDVTLLIENPEAHLHPAGQTILAKLIAYVANQGVQIFLETHSDHILDGILIACKEFEANLLGIDRELVKLFHFDRSGEGHSSVVKNVMIERGGRINESIEGFFDQAQINMSKLLGF